MPMLTFDVFCPARQDRFTVVDALIAGTEVSVEHRGTGDSGWPEVKFTGSWSDLATVVDRYVRPGTPLADAERITLISRITREDEVVQTASVDGAVARVRAYLTEFATLGGLDHDIIHVANYAQLRVCDLNAILDSLKK